MRTINIISSFLNFKLRPSSKLALNRKFNTHSLNGCLNHCWLEIEGFLLKWTSTSWKLSRQTAPVVVKVLIQPLKLPFMMKMKSTYSSLNKDHAELLPVVIWLFSAFDKLSLEQRCKQFWLNRLASILLKFRVNQGLKLIMFTRSTIFFRVGHSTWVAKPM